MSEDHRKINKHSTGTVPKTKYRNNTSYSQNASDGGRNVTNNLVATDWHHSSEFIRNARRNTRNNYFPMDIRVEEQQQLPNQNGLVNLTTTNGAVSPNASSSRRRSSAPGLKCDNVSKYPDKRQIEEKLFQIREYLKITSALMSSVKNIDEPDTHEQEDLVKMVKDLTDSEAKLVGILQEIEQSEMNNCNSESNQIEENVGPENPLVALKNELDVNVGTAAQDMEFLREQQKQLLLLQQKAENKLRDARHIQEKLLSASYDNDMNSASNRKDNKNYSLHDFDAAIKELEERTKHLNEARTSNAASNVQHKILEDVASLHNEIVCLRTANDERSQLIDVLDNRDAELRSQQTELQAKLRELQNRKSQVDQLVLQLQAMDETEQENDDVGGQVRRIVTMKDQLKKLKDMLEIVRTTENVMQNTNGSPEAQAAACDICTSAENFLQKTRQENESNVIKYDNNMGTGMNDIRHKQINKNTREQHQHYTGTKVRTVSLSEKSALQAELQAKKRELEEIMGKHNAGTSNLNHDVGVDNKSEFSCASNTINDSTASSWIPPIMPHQHNRPDSSDRFSSDECIDDPHDYPYPINDNLNLLTLPSLNYSAVNSLKQRSSDNNPHVEYEPSVDYDRGHSVSRTPERNARSCSVATSGYVRERPRANSEQDKNQVQKQLHLIKSVCESMLEQQSMSNNSSSNPNVQQLRNNLTPSPLYSEPHRSFTSPHPHTMNAVNLVQPPAAVDTTTWFGTSQAADIANYQGLLASNSLQTQSFMLNTLNQCCQMLWLQQRELASLRQSLQMLQGRAESTLLENGNPLMSSLQLGLPLDQRLLLQNQSYQRSSVSSNPKINQVSAACSMPNLNHYNVLPPPTHSNLDPTYNNMQQQTGRVLDPCLNNINHLNAGSAGVHNNNTVLHGVNAANINQSMPGAGGAAAMWNGQALNNQVPPGNRANNYWDNFRSYSRQNLLSTKNNECYQNLPSMERSNTDNDRSHPFPLLSFSKSNSEQESVSTSLENTPMRRAPLPRSTRPMDNTNAAASAVPPDVLNINHNLTNLKLNDPLLSCDQEEQDSDDPNMELQIILQACNENSVNISEDQAFNKECIPEQCRRRNEWNNKTEEQSAPKSKLFDELRENVYKEVASLISANEARPDFLIQLFRDLQMIGSDNLRLQILQCIQPVITHSLLTNRIPLESHEQTENEPTVSLLRDGFSMQPTVWSSKPMKNVSHHRNTEIDNELPNALTELVPFLDDHEGENIQHHFLINLKQMLLESDSFKEIVKDSVLQKHFSNVLDDVLEQYLGKKVHDVKFHLVQTVSDLFRGEISFIQLIQETNPDSLSNGNAVGNDTDIGIHLSNDYDLQSKISSQGILAEDNITHLQNDDLAEADQSRGEDELEEEGAVGGFVDVTQEVVKKEIKINTEDSNGIELPTIDFANNAEGLDQVPTRLPTKSKSRSTTPSKNRSNSHQESGEPF